MLMHAAQIQITHVPYRGAAPAVTDLIAGQIDGVVDNPPTVISHIQGGKLRPLAFAAKQRLPLLPDVPTAAEAGVANFEATSWFGIAAPAGTPRPRRRAAAQGDRRGGAHAGDAGALRQDPARGWSATRRSSFAAQIRAECEKLGRDHQGGEHQGGVIGRSTRALHVMPRHSRSKNSVASLAYGAGHPRLWYTKQGVDGRGARP